MKDEALNVGTAGIATAAICTVSSSITLWQARLFCGFGDQLQTP